MHLFSHFGITQRLFAVIALLGVALAGVAAFATLRLSHVVEVADTTENQRVPQDRKSVV